MDFEFLGPAIVGVVGFLTVGGVIAYLVRPLSKRLGLLLEALTRAPAAELGEIRRTLEITSRSLELLEERQAFIEELLLARDDSKRLAGDERTSPTG